MITNDMQLRMKKGIAKVHAALELGGVDEGARVDGHARQADDAQGADIGKDLQADVRGHEKNGGVHEYSLKK